MHYTSRPTVFSNLETLEIDKKVCSNGTGVLVCTKKYGETFLYFSSLPAVELAIIERVTFMAYSSDTAKNYAN